MSLRGRQIEKSKEGFSGLLKYFFQMGGIQL